MIRLFCIAFTLLTTVTAWTQSLTVTGIVKDPDSKPMAGVSIEVVGTSVRTTSNEDGSFSVQLPIGKTELQFSFVGYRTQVVETGGKRTLDVLMLHSEEAMDNVVVIGYGTAKKSDLTGAVVRVNMKELAKLSNVNTFQSLRGVAPGLNVGVTTRPGENPSVGIRGTNSLSSADGQPLIVVDGSIYRGSLTDLNPADIESVDILKDASSSAIYGSQASNGVLLVTTKKGIGNSKPIVSYAGNYSLQSPASLLVPMESKEYTEFFKDVTWTRSRSGLDSLDFNPKYNITQYFKSEDIVRGFNEGQNNDWWGGLTRKSSSQSHTIGIRGKSNDLSYFLSGGYTGVKGFMLNDDYKRYNYRINADAKINRWLNLGIESFFTSSDYSGAAPNVNNAFLLQPFAPIYTPEGSLQIVAGGGPNLNPYLDLNIDNLDKRANLVGNIHADIKLPITGLAYRANFYQNYRTSREAQYNPNGANFTGQAYKNEGVAYDWSFDNIVTYKKNFNKVHDINATFVYGVEKRTGSNTNASAQKFVNGTLGYNFLGAGDPTLNTLASGAYQETSLYTMGRVLYGFKDKYLLTGTVRRDGFSGFGSNNKIGVFPSAAVGWVASNESFIKDNTAWLDFLKFRFSYGSTGNRGVGRYQTLAILKSEPSYVFGEGGTTTLGQYISSMANNNLGWETTTGSNFGVDFTVLHNVFSGTVEYYANNTEGILYNIDLPRLTGFAAVATNIGKVRNHGIEATLTAKLIRSGAFRWEATANYARNRDKIISILGLNKNGVENDIPSSGLFIGKPTGAVYNYEIIGMWQLADQRAGIIPTGFFPGTEKISDLNGDGKYSAADDRKILGYTTPAYRFSIANRVNYKNFGLYIMINSIQGGKNFYLGDDSPYSSGAWSFEEQLKYSNVPKGAWDYWMPENPNARYRRLDAPSAYNPRLYSQRNFIRLQDVSLSYAFSSQLLKKIEIGSLSVFATGKNLVTITKWRGWDPETGQGFAPGIPFMREYSLGVNVEF
ncbi:SusC/RagA family TonB-linked outer membrane protein [Niabella hirudinis]|uniref:SusC/RagA family TonB-linked outer membrane protein n=1 Tax=Niabella hirudinis TaxID=1285929 RepID=UPI003EB7B0D8